MIWFYAWRAIILFLCSLGLALLLLIASHVWEDHAWDDQIRTIQRQQLTQPKPVEK